MRFPQFYEPLNKLFLENLFDFQNGITVNTQLYGKGIKLISVLDLNNLQGIKHDDILNMVNISEKTLNNFAVEYGDVLFQRSSENTTDIGKTNVYLDKKPSTFGCFIIRGKKKIDYNPIYLKFNLESPIMRKRIIIMGAGAQHYNIGQEKLKKIIIYLHNQKEQEIIAELMSKLNERIYSQKKIIEDLHSLKLQIINQLYSGVCSKSKLSEFLIQISKRNKKNLVSTVLSVNNKNGFINQSKQFEDREVASSDKTNYKIIEINMFAYNPARINVGSIARYDKPEKGIISPMYICFKCKDNLDSIYFEYFLESSEFKREMNKRLEGSVRQCLTFESLIIIPFHVLPLKTQKWNAAVITAFTKKINLENEYLKKLFLQKKYLLTKLFI